MTHRNLNRFRLFSGLIVGFFLLLTLQVSLVSAAPTPINLGDTINSNISVAGEIDEYTFTVAAGERVIFDAGPTLVASLSWKLVNPNSETVFDLYLYNSYSVQTLDVAGTYTLSVYVYSGSATGAYNFKLWDGTEEHTISLGDTVSPNVPDAGAGIIDNKDVWDIYSFTAAAGQKIIFDPTNSLVNSLSYLITNPNGEKIADHYFNDNYRAFDLEIPGTYTLRIWYAGETGQYTFKLWDGTDDMTITIGAVITPGSPVPGAGKFETKGMTEVYTFAATAGQAIFLDAQNTTLDLVWSLDAPSGENVFDGDFIDQQVNLEETGNYVLTIDQSYIYSAKAGDYNFTLSAFEGELLSNGSFEPDSADWTGKNLVKDKVKCNKIKPNGQPKLFAHDGVCAMIFKGSVGENSSLSQQPDATVLAASNLLTLSAWVQGKNAGKGSIMAKIDYTSPTAGENFDGKDKIKLKLQPGTYLYQLYNGSLTLDDAVDTVTVMIKYKGTAGSIYVDDVQLRVGAARSAAPEGVLGLPMP